MSTTNTESAVYVVCENYCQKRLLEAGALAHDEQCEAPADEIMRLNNLLAAKRISAAAGEAVDDERDQPDESEASAEEAAAGDEPLAATFVCSCNEPFATMDEIAAHQTATGHEGCADGATTVDGVEAEIVHGDGLLPLPPPEPMTLAKALEHLDSARAIHAKYVVALKEAKGKEKGAQEWVNRCVETLCEVARREAEPELPFDDAELAS